MGRFLHASYSGYFPFCIGKGKIESGSFITTTLKEAMSIYWKVRKMSYVFDHADSPSYIGRKQEGKIQKTPQYAVDFLPLEQEEKLVCPTDNWGYDNTTSYSNGYNSSFGPFPFSQSSNTGSGTIFNWAGIKQEKGVYYIPIDFYLSWGDNTPATYTFNYSGRSDEQPITIKILGYSVKALYWKSLIYNHNPIQITIEPLEYWSYSGLYNTSTGLDIPQKP